MSFWQKIFGSAGSQSNGRPVCIVDAAALISNGGRNGRMSPRNQIDVLQRLSSFAKKEQLEMCVVFAGKPLRQAPDNEKYRDVNVRYTAREQSLDNLVSNVMRELGRGAGLMVITSARAVEQVAEEAGALLMKGDTLKKALEGGKSSDGNRSSRRRPQRPRNRQRRKPDGDHRPQKQKQKKDKGGKDDLGDLIDLVEEAPPKPEPASQQEAPQEASKESTPAPEKKEEAVAS